MAIYIPPTGIESRDLKVNTAQINGKIQAQWFNPVAGICLQADFTKKGKSDDDHSGAHGDGATRLGIIK